jgi:hypothetical protein
MLVVKKYKTKLNREYDSFAKQNLSKSKKMSYEYIRVAEESNRLIRELESFNRHPMDDIRKLLRGG